MLGILVVEEYVSQGGVSAPGVPGAASLVEIAAIWISGYLAFSASSMYFLVNKHAESRMAWVFGYSTFGGVLIDAAEGEHHPKGIAYVVTYDGLPGGHYRSNSPVANKDGHPPE